MILVLLLELRGEEGALELFIRMKAVTFLSSISSILRWLNFNNAAAHHCIYL